MKAAVLYGKEDVRIELVPEPNLKAGEVRVRIGAALTCGTDLKVFRRGYHAKMIVPPAVFGHEMAGHVVEITNDVVGWKLGDRVVVANSAPCGKCRFCGIGQSQLCDDLLFLNGAYAESIVVPSRIVRQNMVGLKADTPFAAAALTEPLACVVMGIEESRITAGQRILVIGTGPIGLMFVRLASHLGCEVSAMGRGTKRMKAAGELGAKHLLEVSPGAGHEVFKELLSSNRGSYDVVIEAVGRTEAWEVAVQFVRKGGLVNFFGGCPAGTSITLDTGLIHYSNLTLLASFHHTPSTIRSALSYIESRVVRLEDFVDDTCELEELPDRLKRMILGNKSIKTLVRV